MKTTNSTPRLYSRTQHISKCVTKKGIQQLICLLFLFQTTFLLKAQQFNCGSYINRQISNGSSGYNTRFDSVSVVGDTAYLTQKLLLIDTLVNASDFYNGYIWAWKQYPSNTQSTTSNGYGGQRLLKIGKNGIVAGYTFLDMKNTYNAATIDASGIYYNIESNSNSSTFTLNRINLTTNPPTLLTDKVITLPTNMIYPGNGSSGDLIFAGGNMYLFINQHGLFKIDTLNNTSQRIFTTGNANDTNRIVGSLYLDANDPNNIYGYGSDANGQYQEDLLQLNLYTGAITEIATHGIQTSQTDGSSCSSSSMFNLTIKGNYFNDADGNTVMQTTENGIQGPGNNGAACATCPISITKYMNLTKSNNTVIESVPINQDGSYTFFHAPTNTANLKLVASSTSYSVGAIATPITLSSGWVETGENISGTNTGSGNGVNGEAITIATTPSSGNIVHQNFGVERAPVTTDLTTTITEPTLNSYKTLNGGSNPPILKGSDAEDMPTADKLTGKKVKITNVPSNTELYYNNILVTNNQVISSFDETKLQIKFTTNPLTTTSTFFKYAYVDAANVVDPTPATYTLNWVHTLPVTLISFSGSIDRGNAKLNWSTANEVSMQNFEIQQSTDGVNWNLVNTVLSKASTSSTNNYTSNVNLISNTNNYFKLKMNNLNGQFQFSNTINLKTNSESKPKVYPTISNSYINVEIPSNIPNATIKIFDMLGKQTLILNNINSVNTKIDISAFPKGTYILDISNSNSKSNTRFIKSN